MKLHERWETETRKKEKKVHLSLTWSEHALSLLHHYHYPLSCDPPSLFFFSSSFFSLGNMYDTRINCEYIRSWKQQKLPPSRSLSPSFQTLPLVLENIMTSSGHHRVLIINELTWSLFLTSRGFSSSLILVEMRVGHEGKEKKWGMMKSCFRRRGRVVKSIRRLVSSFSF